MDGTETVDDLIQKVEDASGVFARHQRLIFKGKVLERGSTMDELKLKDGSKVMLMASSTTATQVGFHWVFICCNHDIADSHITNCNIRVSPTSE